MLLSSYNYRNLNWACAVDAAMTELGFPMTLRSPKYSLKEFSESVLELNHLEILDAILSEMHSIKMNRPRLRRTPKKGTKVRQYIDDLNILVPLFMGATLPSLRHGYVEEAWPLLWKLSGSLESLSCLRDGKQNHMHSYSKEKLVEMGREHWKEYQPTKYWDLETTGQLEQELSAAADLTMKAMQVDIDAGFRPHEAWENTRELYLLLPEEPGLEDDEEPDDPAYDALVEMNKMLDDIDKEDR